mgnify:CR=1 FL=1
MGVFGKRERGSSQLRDTAAFSVANPLALALEPRYMFDAAGAATGAEVAQQAAADALAEAATQTDGGQTGDTTAGHHELVVVDTSVEGYSTLIEGLAPGAEVMEIGAGYDGFQALADALSASGKTYDAIHVVSHGGEGQVQLGTSLLSSDSLAEYDGALSALGAALTADGDLLLYGCEVADGTGQAFIDDLAIRTGADVAASDDPTGAADLGGDWDLEVTTGGIEADLPFSAKATADFTDLLALPADDTPFTFVSSAPSNWSDDGNTLSNPYFTVSGNDSLSGTMDVNFSGGVAYWLGGSTASTGTFTVTADNVDVGTFQLTQLVAGEFATSSNFGNIYIKGYVAGGGTVTSSIKNGADGDKETFTFSGADLSYFSGVNLTSFKLFFTETGGSTSLSSDFEFRSFTTTSAAAPSTDPTITDATYDASTGNLVITGTNFTASGGDDVIANKITLTGEGGETYTLTDTSDVEITSATSFTLTLSATDQAAVNQIFNKDGSSSTGNTAYKVDGAAGFIADAPAISDTTGNGIQVSNVAVPTITDATYDASTGSLVVTGTGLLKASGANNDIIAAKLAFTGEGGSTYTLTDTSDVEITSGTSFTVTLSATDKAALNQIFNKAGGSSTDNTAYNLAAAEDWAAGAEAAVNVADLSGNGINVSNVPAPTITDATYDASTGSLVVTGTGLLKASGAANDIVAAKLTFTGEGGSTYTLTDTSDVEITSGTSFTVTLSATDKAAVNQILNKAGGSSTGNTAYNLAAAEDWAAGAETTVNVADLTGNDITVSNVPAPTITDATYDASTGSLVVTGTGLLKASGAANDIVAAKLTFTGEGGSTYTLTDTSDVEITSGTSFTVTLSTTDKAALNQIFNKDGASSTGNTAYNLAAAEDWAAGAEATVNVADLTGNDIQVSNVPAPTITDATYDYGTNVLTVTGTNFVHKSGAANDVDISLLTLTGEGGATYTLTSATDVEITSGTSFSITLTGADIVGVESLLNKDGPSSAGGTTYNLAAADNWMTGTADGVDIADATNGVDVSNYAAPTITDATYDVSTGQLTVTGANFVNASGAANDVDASLLTLTGEGGSYTLTDSSDVDVTSATSFTITLSATDQLNVNGLLNKDGGTSGGGTTYNLAAADNWMAGAPAANDIADATGNGITVSNVATPTITDATYDSDTGVVTVTGTNLFKKVGAANDIDVSTLTFTGGTGNATYTLTSATDVEITSATSFSVTLSGSDKTNVDALLDQIGTSSSGGSTYNLAAAEDWLAGADTNANIADATAAVQVTISPKISSATYDASTGVLVVTGSNIQANGGGADIDASKFTFTGEGGVTYTLTDTADVERDSVSQFTLTLSATDKLAVNGLLNLDGTSSGGGTTYNLAAADDWDTNETAGDTSDATGNGITVSNVVAPTITNATYDVATGQLVVTGANLVPKSGAANDVDVSAFTFTGEGGATYTLTSATDVEITSATSFTVTLSAADKLAVDGLLNKNGATADSGTTYNLAAAEDWLAGAAASTDIADTSNNGITVSNVAVPAINSATYDFSTGVLTVTGTGFVAKSGAANDVDVSAFTFTGEGGATYTLTSATDVEVTSATSFSLTLSGADKLAVNGLLNKNNMSSDGGTAYNLAAAEDWMAGAAPGAVIADAAATIDVSNYTPPTLTSATFDAATGVLTVTGTGFVSQPGAANDVDLSTLTFTGQGGATYTLTTATDVEVTSATGFSVTLSGADLTGVKALLDKNGTASADATVYNIAGADNWMAGAAASANIADASNNAVTVSGISTSSGTTDGGTGQNITQAPSNGASPANGPQPPAGQQQGGGDTAVPQAVQPIQTVTPVGQSSSPITNAPTPAPGFTTGTSFNNPGGTDVLSIVGNTVSGRTSLVDSFYGAGRTTGSSGGGSGGLFGGTGGGFDGGLGGGLGGGFSGFGTGSVLGTGDGEDFGTGLGLAGDGENGSGDGEGNGPATGEGGAGAPGGQAAQLPPAGRPAFSDQLARAADNMDRLAAALAETRRTAAS